MPVLDARFTPMHSPPSIDQTQAITKPEEDDDDAPPQLSPNIFVSFYKYKKTFIFTKIKFFFIKFLACY